MTLDADKIADAQVEGAAQVARAITQGREVVVATSNAHKLEEINAILGTRFGLHCVSAQSRCAYDEPTEDGLTFEENALIKARAAHKACGCAALADDSGLMVDLLDGAPGIYSARYAGEHGNDGANNARLIEELSAQGAFEGDALPAAQFVCALAYINEEGSEQVVRGVCEGTITPIAQGSHGFGYDPHFIPNEYREEQKSMAELLPEEKNALSHRRRALENLSTFFE